MVTVAVHAYVGWPLNGLSLSVMGRVNPRAWDDGRLSG